jgi:hypothetical protein
MTAASIETTYTAVNRQNMTKYDKCQLTSTRLAWEVHPTNRVRTLFTSVGNEADRVGPMYPLGFAHLGYHAFMAVSYAPYGSGCWLSGCFPNTVGFIPHGSK